MPRPLVSEMVRIGDGPEKSSGRWRVNAGSEMVMAIEGINDGNPIRVVVDLGSLSPRNPRIVALADHDPSKVVGYWADFKIDPTVGVEAAFYCMALTPDEVAVMPDVAKVQAQVRNNVPIQASIGAVAGPSGKWEKVAKGATVSINGKEYAGDGELPLYILRGGELFETSIVTFGADSETGRVAAAKKPPVETETPMSDKLKVLLGKFPEKHHGLVARCVAEDKDETHITNLIHAAELKERDDEIVKLKASIDHLLLKSEKKDDEEEKEVKAKAEGEGCDDGKMKADDYNQGDSEKKEEQEALKKIAHMAAKKSVKHGEGKSTTEPTTVTEAMTAAMKAGAKERGFALRAKVLADNPNLKRI